ncbi:hypothetical protein Trydic_g23713 [Trypoxylus dichotomus]
MGDQLDDYLQSHPSCNIERKRTETIENGNRYNVRTMHFLCRPNRRETEPSWNELDGSRCEEELSIMFATPEPATAGNSASTNTFDDLEEAIFGQMKPDHITGQTLQSISTYRHDDTYISTSEANPTKYSVMMRIISNDWIKKLPKRKIGRAVSRRSSAMFRIKGRSGLD